MMRRNFPSAMLALTLVSGTVPATAQQDTAATPAFHSLSFQMEGQWSSNALNKYVLAGAAFGGDISAPVRSLAALTRWKDGGIAGGYTRAGVTAILPAMELFDAPEWGRWETVVALETTQWAEASWSPAAATLVFGRQGVGDDGSLQGTSCSLRSATTLRIGGIRSRRTHLRGVPMEMEVEWGVRVGEVHRYLSGGTDRQSYYLWNDSIAEADIGGLWFRSLTAGSTAGFDAAIGLVEANGGHGRRDAWFLSLRNVGGGGRLLTEVTEIDTLFSTEGWPLLTGGGPTWETAGSRDTLIVGFSRLLPHTLAFRWDREAMRVPGIRWTLTAEKLSIAPRWQVAVTRKSGRGALQTEVGLGWGGWGGTYIPLNFNLPSRAVRQGRPGGQLSIGTRWLALAGTGGRMGLGLHWHRTF